MSATRIRPGVIFELARELDSLPAGLKLRNLEWGLLFAVTGEHTVAQIADHFRLAPEERDVAFARLAETGLIVEREVTVKEYLSAAATLRDDQPKTLARFLRAGAALETPAATHGPAATSSPETGSRPAEPVRAQAPTSPQPETPPKRSPLAPASLDTAIDDNLTRAVPILGPVDFEPLAGPPPAQRPATPAPPRPRAPQSPPRPASPMRPPTSQPRPSQPARLEAPTPSTAEPSAPPRRRAAPRVQPSARRSPAGRQGTPAGRRLSLKALMQFILSRANDPTSGQLDIYRVFIRVNTQLLKRNGITTLRFSEDRLIADPELQQAIASSVRKSLGVNCPSQVFV